MVRGAVPDGPQGHRGAGLCAGLALALPGLEQVLLRPEAEPSESLGMRCRRWGIPMVDRSRTTEEGFGDVFFKHYGTTL